MPPSSTTSHPAQSSTNTDTNHTLYNASRGRAGYLTTGRQFRAESRQVTFETWLWCPTYLGCRNKGLKVTSQLPMMISLIPHVSSQYFSPVCLKLSAAITGHLYDAEICSTLPCDVKRWKLNRLLPEVTMKGWLHLLLWSAHTANSRELFFRNYEKFRIPRLTLCPRNHGPSVSPTNIIKWSWTWSVIQNHQGSYLKTLDLETESELSLEWI